VGKKSPDSVLCVIRGVFQDMLMTTKKKKKKERRNEALDDY
jgi:hypothetical protein